ncbi:MAG: hypothetical protein FJZ16_00605 [Candidatus Omnitrophica bacterium]|nr:hypothetical protein [Candidatus Omnitrophota bacterium]
MDNSTEIIIRFQGPFTLLKGNDLPCILESPLKKGIYFWAVPVEDKDLIYYVGITTRAFSKRMIEHLKGYLSGEYGIYEPVELQKGKRLPLPLGDIEDFIKRHNELYPKLLDSLKLFRVYIAPVSCEKRLLERIESAIAGYLKGHGGLAAGFQNEHVNYRVRRKDENPVVVKLECSSKRIDLPPILEV